LPVDVRIALTSPLPQSRAVQSGAAGAQAES
jgi:hypothetical protein